MEESLKPCLKVTGLHIEGLKALRRVDWPADGMGWQGRVPDMVMVGGVNGSGKTTLLDALVQLVLALQQAMYAPYYFLPQGATANAWVDLYVQSGVTGASTLRVLVGDRDFVERNATTASCTWAVRDDPGPDATGKWHVAGAVFDKLAAVLGGGSAYESSDVPSLIWIPADRQLAIPSTSYKSPGRALTRAEFYYKSRQPKAWDESLEAILYNARWADLNAKEEGHAEQATHFESYAAAFRTFFQESKSLVWEQGELVVRVASTGAAHSLSELSSGEQQVIVLAAELYRKWRPGSLILIDEPELHFHPTWQAALWGMLEKWQRERGGQVIVTTQSNHLFGIAEPGTTVLLGEGAL
jgi:predicted ATPase